MWSLKVGGSYCYNTCEVVREYCDEKNDKEKLNKMEPHFVDEHGNLWYAYKTQSENIWTGEAGGGNWGREPGKTCDYNETTSIHNVNQHKHVNRPYKDETAEGVKKIQAPQMTANAGEDGIKTRERMDNDPPAEAMEKEKSTNVNDPGHGSGGIRVGAAYDNAQQDTGQKDNPRKVIQEKYTGQEDYATGADNENFNKAAIIINTLNFGLKKRYI